jgi:hypothetical protein
MGISVERCIEQITQFSGESLTSTIAKLEEVFVGKERSQIVDQLQAASISEQLLEAAHTIKRTAAQIDVILHALGILLLLPSILEEGERVESLSLGAGSSGARRVDLETDLRMAEFTFINWRGNDSTRLQKIFKDFYRLAEIASLKRKELWLTDDAYVQKYFNSRSSVRSATHKHRDIWEDFQRKYPNIERVSEYYRLHSRQVLVKVYDESSDAA